MYAVYLLILRLKLHCFYLQLWGTVYFVALLYFIYITALSVKVVGDLPK